MSEQTRTIEIASSESSAFVAALIKAELVPELCKHITIDLPAQGVITITYTVFADARLNDPGVLDAVANLRSQERTVIAEVGELTGPLVRCDYISPGGTRCEDLSGHSGDHWLSCGKEFA